MNEVMQPQPSPLPAAARPKHSGGALQGMAHLSIIFLTLYYFGTALLSWFAQQATHAVAGPQRGTIPYTSYANVEGAHFTFTNMASFTQWSCVKGTLTNNSTRRSISSFPVCSGERAPHSSASITAGFRGEIRDVCGKDSGGYLGRTIDWDTCAFQTAEADESDLHGS
jgi:hypothetical protein